MTDQKRNQNQPSRGQQGSEETQRTSPQHHEEMDQGMGSTSQNRSTRDTAETADDRGMDRSRRSFSGDREHDELGSEIDETRSVDDTGDLDDDLGGSGRSNR